MLNIQNLDVHYGQSQILSKVNLHAETGRVTCVMGTNGVGKTTLLKAISGTHHRSSGDYHLNGESLGRPAAHILAAKGVAYVPQGRMIFPLLTVTENLMTGFACLPRAARSIPGHIYELFPVLKDMAQRRGGDLSGGQQQQLAIARALIMQPKLLLLDEPTEGIQPNIIQQIGRVIGLLRDEGKMAIVLVEQYFDFAFDLGDSFTVLKRGEIVLEGSKHSLSRETLLQAASV
jgi:urea transport system ATP-binding protein